MFATTLRRALLAWTLAIAPVGLVGCAVDAGEDSESTPADEGVELGSVDSDGKAESLGTRTVVWDERDQIEIDDREYVGNASITSVTDHKIRVSSDRLILRPGIGEPVHIAISPKGMIDSVFQTMAFVLFYRRAGSTAWEMVEVPATYGSQSFKAFLFEEVLLLPASGEADLHLVIASNIGLMYKSATVPFEGFGDVAVEYSVAAIPAGAWGDLEGDYDFVLEATCGDGAC